MVEFAAFAVLFGACLAALARHNRFRAGGRTHRRAPDRFELFWSRRNGRVLALSWLAIFMLAWLAPFAVGIGDQTIWGSVARMHPIRDAVLVGIQSIAAVLLVPLTAGLYVYRRAIPQIARDEADEREQIVQGLVYRRAHLLIILGLAVIGIFLAALPIVGRYVLVVARDHGLGWAELLVPAWVLLFMLPSLVYAWMVGRREDEAEAATR